MANLNKVIYLTEEQKEALFTNGTLTVNGQTITYNDNDIYITMDRTGQGKAHIVNETTTPLATVSGLVEGQTYYSGDYFTVSCEQPCSVGISFDKEEHYMELIAYPIKGATNTYKFQLPELLNDFTIGVILLGDANENGLVAANDATRILRWTQSFGENASLSPLGLLAADINRDGAINEDDATLLHRYLAGGEYVQNNSIHWNVVNSDIIPIPEKNQAGKILVATNNNKYELQDAPTGGGSSSGSGADWEEDDSTASSYIQNKPPIKAGSHAEHPGIIEGMIEDEDYYDSTDDETYRIDANDASGVYAHAEGYHTKAIESCSHAEGHGTIASGIDSHAEGYSTKAIGHDSHAEGDSTRANGAYSHAEGYGTNAIGPNSHSEGDGTDAIGNYSHAEGFQSTAIGEGSHVEGRCSSYKGSTFYFEVQTAPNNNQYTISGTINVEPGNYIYFDDITKGAHVRSINENSITLSQTIGDITYRKQCHIEYGGAVGDYSHAEGKFATASGEISHAEGWNTIAASNYQHVQGKFNIADNQNIYADIVGNGTTLSKRSNAYTLDWNGNGWYAGTVEASAILLRSSTPNSTKVFRITVDDTGTLTTAEVK